MQRAPAYFDAEVVAESAGAGLWSLCAPAAEYVPCGDAASEGAGSSKVHARRVDCPTALEIARRFFPDPDLDEAAPPTINGFRCRTKPLGVELGAAVCSDRAGLRVVRFEYGA